MLGLMSMRSYLFIGLCFGALVWLMSYLLGPDLINGVVAMEADAMAAGLGIFAQLICQPIIWVMRNGIIGAIVVALTWPLVIVWVFLYVGMILAAAGFRAARDVSSEIN